MAKMNRMREQMKEAFISSLKEKKIPWQQGWDGLKTAKNAVTNTTYRGLNRLWLKMVGEEKGYSDPRWCTFKQANDKGWKIKKGEKGTKIEFFSFYDVKEKKKIDAARTRQLQKQLTPQEFYERIKPTSSIYTVFNAEQITGIPALETTREHFDGGELVKQRDALIRNMNVGFEDGVNYAAYNPGKDTIKMPFVEQFHNAYEYMATFLHEAGHASGHPDRLYRNLWGKPGSKEYAQEELRAEIASSFVAQELGIGQGTDEHIQNHKAYVQDWIDVLENNPNELFQAIKDAEQIADYLMEKGEFHSLEKKLVQEKSVDQKKELDKEMEVTRETKPRRELQQQEMPLEQKEPVKILGLYEWQGKDGYVHYQQGDKQFLSNGETIITDVEYVDIKNIGNMKKTQGIDSKLFAEKLEIFHPEIGFSDSQIKWIDNSTEKANAIPPEDNGIKILGLYEKEGREHYIHYEIGGKEYLAAEKEIYRGNIVDKILASEKINEVNAISKDILSGIRDIPYYYADRLSDTLSTMVRGNNIVIDKKENIDFEKIQKLASMEEQLKIPEEKRLTDWFGDYAIYEPKLGVSAGDIETQFREYTQELSMKNNSFLQRNNFQNTTIGQTQPGVRKKTPAFDIGR